MVAISGLGVGMVSLWRVWAALALVLSTSSAVNLKSVQVWAPEISGAGGVTGQIPGIYAWNAEATSAAVPAGVGARAPLSSWTFVGCHRFTGSATPQQADTPVTCAIACEGVEGGAAAAAMQGNSCFCLSQDWERYGSSVEETLCDQPCVAEYFSATTRLCGGSGQHFSVYRKYDFVHQTAQGCYDPWRFIWYQSVAVERGTYDGSGQRIGSEIQWYLHATSINSGDPLFPYQRRLEQMLLGMQYDLDNSRLVGYTVQSWTAKGQTETWIPTVHTYTVSSQQENSIGFTPQVVPFSFDGSDAAEFLLSTGITALDALHDVYYLTVPQIPEDTGFGLRYDSFRMRLYGINLNAEEDNRVILDVLLDQRIAVLEANSEYHDLFALMLDDDSALESNRFMYVRLGASYRTPREQQVQFNWTFSSPLASVVNPFSYEGFTDKVYQVGSSAVDHVSNTSFLVLKDRPDAEAPFSLADINQRGFTFSQDYSPLESPGVQATWLVNTDPMIPLTLAAPKLISARFAIDGRSILVEFDSFTVQGALPIDNDGDFIPDDIDWSAQHTGLRHCSDIFSRQTAELLGDMPQTACEWLSASTIKIQLSKGFEAVKVGDGLFLKDKTVYAYLAEGNAWSMAASGGIRVGYPDPFDAPEVVVTFVKTVDLCSGVTLDALESYKHGDQPQWTWGLDQVACEDGRSATPDITVWVEEKLAAASVGGTTMTGEHNVTFDKDELEPGCTYTIAVSLTGRWGLTSTKQLTVTKKPIPVPQVLVQNPDLVTTQRASVLTLQSQIEESKCESLLVTRRTLRFEWLAQNEAVNSVTGALETKPVDLGLLVPRIFSASLVVPPLKLQPEVTYRFTVRVGFEETWTDVAQTTSDEVVVTVTRSPIKVSVVGGGREVSKGNPIALDARSSFDPDFPEDLVEDNPAWTFEFQCTTPNGVPCFPVTSPSPPDLPDVRPCKGSTETFKDLGNNYDLPAFSSEVLASDAYYCLDSARNGVLILNVPSTNAFSPGDYIFTVIGSAHGRTASATMTLVVSELLPAPQVVVEPLSQERVVTTQRLRLTGDLIDEDKAQYGDTVAWSWSFFRKETNPLWSQSAATEASNAEVPYLVPRTIFIEATELDPARGVETFLSDPFSSSSLVLRANVLQPSTTYAFRLSATAPAPPGSPGETRVGYAEVEVATAGPPPVPGTLLVEPPGQSYVDEEKLLTAVDWSAEDTPLQYAFSYRTDLQSQFSERVSLRVGPISAPSQRVKCMRAGEASDAFTVELTVTVSSLYGATSELTIAYKVLPPADLALSNQRLLSSAEQTDPQTRALLLGCVDLSADGRAAAAAEDGSGSSSAAESAVAEQEARKNQADAMMDLLSSAFDIAQITRPVVSTNLKVVQQLAGSGTVTTKMVDFLEKTTQEVTSLADSSSSDEERDAVVLNYFNTLGAMGLVAVASSAVAGSLQQRTADVDGAPRTGVYFPSSTTFFSGFERSEWSLVTLPPGAQRRLQAGGGANASSPVWASLASMYEEQEALERAWRTFIGVTQAQDSYNQLEAARDDEYLANYTAHLGPEEREIVLRAWWEEKARQEAATAAELQLQSGLTRKMMTQIRDICAVLVKYMLDGEAPKEFIFPMGAIRLGKSRDLSAAANRSFAFGDPGWKLTSEQEGAYGWQNIKFTQVNPMQWAPDTPRGPFLIDALEVYTEDGTTIPVERQATPIALLGEHSSFAAARCLFWDWQSNNGLGAWETTGVLNSDNGCASTHSGIVGMFLDFSSPIVELPSAQESVLEHTDERYNREVIIAIAVALVLSAILHYWAFKQDAVDRLKPVEMRKLGDGISQARTQDDPIYYTPNTALQAAGTFRNLARRDHIVFACLYRCPKLKVTRLQKAAVLFANFCSVAGVAAVFHAEHLVDPRHYVEVGIIVATLTFPMVEALSMMFASRPAHEGAMQEGSAGNAGAGEVAGPLEAMPVTEDEAEGEPPQGAQESGPSTAWPAPAALPPLPLLASSHPVAGPETGGGPQLATPAHVPKAPAAPGTLPPAPPAPPPLPAQAGGGSGPQPGGLPPRAPGPPAPGPPGRPPGGSPAGPPPGVPAQGPGEAWSPQVAAGGSQGGQDAVQELPVVLPGSTGLGPAAAAAQHSQPLALPGGADADLVMPPPEESSSGQAALSQTQRQLLRRVRRMYIERVIQNSERLAYDERVDMRSRIPHPMAHLATVLAHVAVGCFSVVSLALVITYGVHFGARAATSWAYSCTSGWLFMWLILEVVKITLSTILELSQLNQRRRLHDHPKLKDKVALKKAMKMKQMSAMAHASNVAAPKMLSLVPAPLPDEPPPAMGDASAG